MRIGDTDKVVKPLPVKPSGRVVDSPPLATKGDLLGIEKAQELKITPLPTPRFFSPRLLMQSLLFDSIADPDLERYQGILKGRAREDLKKFKTPGEMFGVKGGKIVSIPVPKIGIPHFTRGSGKGGGAGQGEGKEGDVIGQPGDAKPGKGAGSGPGEHIQEIFVPMTLSEIAETIIKDRKLPYLKPKGYGVAKEKSIRWNTKSKVGIDLDMNATIINAIKRVSAEIGDKFDLETDEGLNALLDQVGIEEQDKVFISWREIEKPQVSAVIIYKMDVSGSVTDAMKEKVRKAARWLSLIIQYQFGVVRAELRGDKFSNEHFGEGVEEVFIIHDSDAREVTEEEFYTTRESGGTKISSAYELEEKIINERYDPDTWNIYSFYFGDGDNWGDDTPSCIDLMKRLADRVNEVGYVQVESDYGGGGEFYEYVKEFTAEKSNVRAVRISAEGTEDLDKVIDSMLGEEVKKD